MSSAENGRLVWIPDRLIESVRSGAVGGGAGAVVARYDASVANAERAVCKAVSPWIYGANQSAERDICAQAVLAALGVPDVPQRPTPRDETP